MKKIAVSRVLCLAVLGLTFQAQAQNAKEVEAGFKSETSKIYLNVESKENIFNNMFDFSRLQENKKLPPVVKVNFNKEDSKIECNIDSPCKILKKSSSYCSNLTGPNGCTPVSWRTYIYKDFPSFADMEKNKDIVVLDTKDFKEGQEKAQKLFNRNMQELKVDYIGMSAYKVLEDRKMVAEPTKKVKH